MIEVDELDRGLARACARVGLGEPSSPERLTGGATMESWRFSAGGESYILRRAPSLEFIAERPMSHHSEAAVIEAARKAGVTAPEVMTVLEESDGIGSGFVMRALPGTPNPKEILQFDEADALLKQAARDLARIHSLRREDVPDAVPVMNYREAIADLTAQFEEAGGDRPIIALGLKWMEDNCPDEVEPVLNHGDYRMGNLLAEPGKLTGVLDWELAHFGDRHEDLAFGCMAVWRFARYDRPALGLGSLEDYFAAYEAEAGIEVDRERFRYWLVHRTVWWAMGCLKCAKAWREGTDRMLERVVISRRTSEQELDLLMLLEEDAPEEEKQVLLGPALFGAPPYQGEATDREILLAVAEWLETLRSTVQGHDKFQLAVARNALGMVTRNMETMPAEWDSKLCDLIFAGELTLADPNLLAKLRFEALTKLEADVPKYPALAVAREAWPEIKPREWD